MAEPAGEEVPIVWQGRRAWAFVPTRLADRDLGLTPRTVQRTAAAGAEITLSAEQLPADYEPLARLLLRGEGVASSYIEGVTAPLVDVVLAETDPHTRRGPADWVAANLSAVRDAVAAQDTRLSVELLCSWHATIMAGSPTPARQVGTTRTEQGWIGGTSPLDAALVTPPPERLPALLADLVDYANREDADSVAQAAIAHAQLEVIHPSADGNGRVGRVLVSWLLSRRLHLVTPPPVSVRLAADRGGYLAGLATFRLGQHDPWVRWFADAVSAASQAQRALLRRLDELTVRWRGQLAAPRNGRGLRSDASAWAVLDLLPRHLVLTASLVGASTGQTTRSAGTALRTLVEAGVLVEHAGAVGRLERGRPSRRYVSPELLGLVGSTSLG